MSDLKSGEPTISDLKEIQRRCNLLTVHVVWIGPARFAIAHTGAERGAVGPGFDLDDCSLHEWLSDCYTPPATPGYYVATPDDFGGFDFTPLDLSDMSPEAVLR